MTDQEQDLVVRIGQYDRDVLGIPGLVFGNGEIDLYCADRTQWLRLPAGAKEIVDDIRARSAARQADG